MERKKDSKLNSFVRKLKAHYPDAKIFLFGSRAGEDFFLTSDYDIIVVSEKFEGINFFKRTEKIYDYWVDDLALDVFCYTSKEFDEKKQKIGFLSEAMNNAILVSA
ncbi:MAG: nucleotidyltransferase domain-containing protein [Candidatus Diapherotrites archaeon]